MTYAGSLRNGVPAWLRDAWNTLNWRDIIPSGHNYGHISGHQHGTDLQYRSTLLLGGSQLLPRPSHDLGYRLVTSKGAISPIEFISTSIYLLSNGLHDFRDNDKGLELLCSLFEHNIHQVTILLQSQLQSARAAWQPLLQYTIDHRRSGIFRYLVSFWISNKSLSYSHSRILYPAVSMVCFDVVRDVLNHVAEFDYNPSWVDILEAILAACCKGEDEIARLIMRKLGVHTEYPVLTFTSHNERAWLFLAFVVWFDSNEDGHLLALDLFLSEGADVDKPLPSNWRHPGLRELWYDENEVNSSLHPTVLDFCYRINHPLYEKLMPHSKASVSRITKISLLLSLEQGSQSLQAYFSARLPARPEQLVRSALELLWVEEMMPDLLGHRHLQIPGRARRSLKPSLRNLHTLLRIGPFDGGGNLILRPNTHYILNTVLSRLREHVTVDGLRLLEVLVREVGIIREHHLANAVQLSGCEVLEFLQPRVTDFLHKAALALAEAARLDNFEAVRFLLRSGANPRVFIDCKGLFSKDRMRLMRGVLRSAFCPPQEQAFSVQAIAAGLLNPMLRGDLSWRVCSLSMSKLLSEEGAQLVITRNDSTPFSYATFLAESSRYGFEGLTKLEHFFSDLRERNAWANPPARLLELVLCDGHKQDRKRRLDMFECLLSHGGEVSPGSPLAALIQVQGPKELVERVLHLGADLEAYCFTYPETTPLQAAASSADESLVTLILGLGANVNAPARGRGGRTALQAICTWDPATEKEHDRKMRIYSLLINKGADVNAGVSPDGAYTALGAAAYRGDLDIAVDLLSRGAYVNAQWLNPRQPSLEGFETALDIAAGYGRLDMVKLLLNANALSSLRGSSGYEGAIQRSRSYPIVADLIREHAKRNLELGLFNGEMLIPPEECYARSHETYESSSEDEGVYDSSGFGHTVFF